MLPWGGGAQGQGAGAHPSSELGFAPGTRAALSHGVATPQAACPRHPPGALPRGQPVGSAPTHLCPGRPAASPTVRACVRPVSRGPACLPHLPHLPHLAAALLTCSSQGPPLSSSFKDFMYLLPGDPGRGGDAAEGEAGAPRGPDGDSILDPGVAPVVGRGPPRPRLRGFRPQGHQPRHDVCRCGPCPCPHRPPAHRPAPPAPGRTWTWRRPAASPQARDPSLGDPTALELTTQNGGGTAGLALPR